MNKLPIARFNLKNPNSDKQTLILMFFRYKGKKLQYSTGFSISPKDWNKKDNRAFLKEHRNDLIAINSNLDDLASKCTKIYIDNNYGDVSLKEFKTELDLRTNKVCKAELNQKIQKTSKKITFNDFMDLEFKEMEQSGIKKTTLKTVRLHIEIIKRFGQTLNSKSSFTFQDVNWEFRSEFIKWMVKNNSKLSYGNKTLKTLRQFLESGRRKNLHNNKAYQGKGWIVQRKKAKGQIVTLSTNELEHLSKLKLSSHLEKVRDICLIGAGTGQRHSDFSKFMPEQFSVSYNGVPLLSVISTKTATPVKVPLNIFSWLIPILEKHNYTTPKMSQQKFNDGIKELAKFAGFDKKVLVVHQFIGRQARVEKHYIEKYKILSSHSCRRSFATNLYRMGFRISQIMPMTGHSSESQLREYIGIDNEENAEEIGFMFMKQN